MQTRLEELEARLNQFSEDVELKTAPPNCRGTLLYLLGERDEEYFAWQEDIVELLQNKYRPIFTIPDVNDLAIWHDGRDFKKVLHAGLVMEGGQSPLIRSRIGPGWECPVLDLSPSALQKDLDDEYIGMSKLQYYRLLY